MFNKYLFPKVRSNSSSLSSCQGSSPMLGIVTHVTSSTSPSYTGNGVVSSRLYQQRTQSWERLSHPAANDKDGTPSQLFIPTSVSFHYLPGPWFSFCLLFCWFFSSLKLIYRQASKTLPKGTCVRLTKARSLAFCSPLLMAPPTRIALPSSSCPSLTWWRYLAPQLEGLKALS